MLRSRVTAYWGTLRFVICAVVVSVCRGMLFVSVLSHFYWISAPSGKLCRSVRLMGLLSQSKLCLEWFDRLQQYCTVLQVYFEVMLHEEKLIVLRIHESFSVFVCNCCKRWLSYKTSSPTGIIGSHCKFRPKSWRNWCLDALSCKETFSSIAATKRSRLFLKWSGDVLAAMPAECWAQWLNFQAEGKPWGSVTAKVESPVAWCISVFYTYSRGCIKHSLSYWRSNK